MKPKNADDDAAGGGNRFYACYLLTSLSPLSRSATYIGFTVNPRRRIRQHNGEITSGACRTKKRRPWEMVLCIYGFPTNVSALQFEWAWQHPRESKAVRQAVASFKSFNGIANKIKLAYTMLGLPPWQSLNITVNYFSTKHSSCSSGSPSLPEHMKVEICPMEELPCYTKTVDDGSLLEGEDEDSGSYEDASISDDLSRNAEEDAVEGEDGGKRINMNGDAEEAFRDDRSIIENASIEQNGWFKEGRDWAWASSSSSNPSPEVDHVLNVSPPRRTSLIRDEFSVREMRDGNVLVLIDESGSKRKEPANGGANHSAEAPHQIEVIDLLSPSPDCRMWSVSKKGRFSAAISPQIIDLT
ncbi:Structure-specific endonuclease subunit SLX1 [Linum perenne]